MNLKSKLGPLPRWAWLLLAAGGGYLLWRRLRPGTATNVERQLTTVPLTSSAAGVSGSDMGLATSAGSPADSLGLATSDQLATFSASQTGLLEALENTNQDVVTLATSQLAAAQQTAVGSFQTETQAITSPQPGGSNAPTVIYVQPTVQGGVSSPAAGASAVVKSAVTTPTRFYTYAAQAQQAKKAGQSVRFHAGKGYYLA